MSKSLKSRSGESKTSTIDNSKNEIEQIMDHTCVVTIPPGEFTGKTHHNSVVRLKIIGDKISRLDVIRQINWEPVEMSYEPDF